MVNIGLSLSLISLCMHRLCILWNRSFRGFVVSFKIQRLSCLKNCVIEELGARLRSPECHGYNPISCISIFLLPRCLSQRGHTKMANRNANGKSAVWWCSSLPHFLSCGGCTVEMMLNGEELMPCNRKEIIASPLLLHPPTI